MYCPHCGAQIQDGAVFCGSCGKNINAPREAARQRVSTAPPKKPQGSIAPLIIILITVLIICAGAVACVIYITSQNSAETTITLPSAPTEAEAKSVLTVESEPRRDTHMDTDDEYFFPSDSEYVTVAYLDTLNRSEVALLRNEIYARHGYVFTTEPFKSYFAQKSWYYEDIGCDEKNFSDIEKANRDFIVEYERQKGWRK